MGPLVGVFTFVLILTNIQARHQHSSSTFLSRLLSPRSLNSQSPVIVIIDTRNQDQIHLDDNERSEEYDGRDDESPGDEEAYQLYNQLRSQPDDDLSSDEAETLKETKQVLRTALISRCRKMDQCAKKCPKQKKFACVMVCQEKFDKENACDEPVEEPKCRKVDECGGQKKWGKTMPPKWLIF